MPSCRDTNGVMPCGNKAMSNAEARSAISGGLIERGVCCVCGRCSSIVGHHDDYRFPFHLVWMCRWCHQQMHTFSNRNKELDFGFIRRMMALAVRTGSDAGNFIPAGRRNLFIRSRVGIGTKSR